MKDDWWLRSRGILPRSEKIKEKEKDSERVTLLKERIKLLEGLLDEAKKELDGGGQPPPHNPFPPGWLTDYLQPKVEAPPEAEESPYERVGWTWKERILQVIQAHGSPLTVKEIFVAYDDAFPGSWAYNLANTISVVVSKMARTGAVVRIPRPGVAGAAYGLPGGNQVYINPNIDRHA
jgi:hypothetical protein